MLRSLPREKLAFFRQPWCAPQPTATSLGPLLLWALQLSVGRCRVRSADFGSAEARAGEQAGAMSNSVERFVGKDDESFEDVIDTSHNAPGNPWDNARL
eukprot:COSAG04_NODE_42_length_32379_cov_41.656691_11_plen_99_part_00